MLAGKEPPDEITWRSFKWSPEMLNSDTVSLPALTASRIRP